MTFLSFAVSSASGPSIASRRTYGTTARLTSIALTTRQRISAAAQLSVKVPALHPAIQVHLRVRPRPLSNLPAALRLLGHRNGRCARTVAYSCAPHLCLRTPGMIYWTSLTPITPTTRWRMKRWRTPMAWARGVLGRAADRRPSGAKRSYACKFNINHIVSHLFFA